jgi:FkbM family methyltransferase
MPGIRLDCFEPEQRAIARFKERIGDNVLVCLREVAVADIDGEKLFWASTGKAGHMDDWDYSGSLHQPTGHMKRSPEIGFKEPIAVPCIRLDSWFSREEDFIHGVVDFIWADVQGSQRDVIAGGQIALARTRYLYIECHHPLPLYEGEPSREELIALLPGFEPLGFYGRDNILFQHKGLQ